MTEEQEAERLADSCDLDIKAEGLREAADAWERSLSYALIGVDVSGWLRGRADAVEEAAERLRDSVPHPDVGGSCQIVDVDGEPVRIQGDTDMPAEVREALADVVRTVRGNHGEAAGD